MDTIVASILILIGLILLIFGRWLVPLGVSLLYSPEQLSAIDRRAHSRVRRMRIVAMALYALVGAAFVAAGISGLTG